MSEAARRYCAQITRRQAANFYYGMRLLPARKRDGLFAIYAFARRVDDIGDGPLPVDEKRRQLEGAAESLGRSPDGDPVLVALREAEHRFPLERQSFLDLIEGVRMDVEGSSYERFDQLVVYCRRARIVGAEHGDAQAPDRARDAPAVHHELIEALVA